MMKGYPTMQAFAPFLRIRPARQRAWPVSCTLAILLALSACMPGSELGPVPPYDPNVYLLGVDDQVRVVTYGEDQLTLDFRIDVAGDIAVPLLGTVHAQGLTTQQLGARISALLEEKKLLSHASVSVEVSAYRTVSVLGEVAKPGQYPYQPGMTMLTAVAEAGGFTYRAVEGYALVVRHEDTGEAATGRLVPQDYIKPGDVVTIYERAF